jgi:hypothetical protein
MQLAADGDSDSDATASDDEHLGLRIKNAGLKRQLEQATVEIEALKRARKQAADGVIRILTALQAE